MRWRGICSLDQTQNRMPFEPGPELEPSPIKMTEPRVVSVALSIERKGLSTVTVTHAFGTGKAVPKQRTVVYVGRDLALAIEAVETWTAKIVQEWNYL